MPQDVLNLLVILYVSDTQYSLAYFTVKTKAYNVIISRTVQLWLLFKNVISFCLNSTVQQYNVIANLGTFFMSHPCSNNDLKPGYPVIISTTIIRPIPISVSFIASVVVLQSYFTFVCNVLKTNHLLLPVPRSGTVFLTMSHPPHHCQFCVNNSISSNMSVTELLSTTL